MPKPPKKDQSKIGTVVGIVTVAISAIGLIITFYYSHRNIELMELQRKTALLPDISVQSPINYAACLRRSSVNEPLLIYHRCYENCDMFKVDSLKSTKHDGLFATCKVNLELLNGAGGIAKNITLNWFYDKNKAHNLLTKFIKGLKINYQNKGRLLVEFKDISLATRCSSDQTTKIGSLKANTSLRIALPDDYTTGYLSYLLDSDRDPTINYDLYPPITLFVEFQDIEGKLFNKSFLITPYFKNSKRTGQPSLYFSASIEFEIKENSASFSQKY